MTTATATQAGLDAQAYQALADADGNTTKAAETLGLARSTFRNRIARHEARIAQDAATETEPQGSPFAADPANPTEDEMAAAVERGLADGTVIDAGEWMARQEAEADVFTEILDRDPELRAIEETTASFEGKPVTEDPDESLVALLEDGEPVPAEIDPDAASILAAGMTGGLAAAAGRLGEVLASVTEATEPPAPAKPAKAAAAGFPEGVVTPVAFRHLLVAEGTAPETLTTQRVYDWVKKNRTFPVKHYGQDGAAYDEPQAGSDGKPATRPGVPVDLARDWYVNRPARQPKTAAPALYEDGQPAPRLADLIAGTAEPAPAEIAALFAAYTARAAREGEDVTLTAGGFAGWLVAGCPA